MHGRDGPSGQLRLALEHHTRLSRLNVSTRALAPTQAHSASTRPRADSLAGLSPVAPSPLASPSPSARPPQPTTSHPPPPATMSMDRQQLTYMARIAEQVSPTLSEPLRPGG